MKHSRQMKHLLLAGGIALALASSPVLAGTSSMLPVPHVVLHSSTEKPLSNESVRNIIVFGSRVHEWQVVAEQPGKITLKYVKSSSTSVTLDVSYTSSGYDIAYVDSTGMAYRKEGDVVEIHPSYNRWMANLVEAIGEANKIYKVLP